MKKSKLTQLIKESVSEAKDELKNMDEVKINNPLKTWKDKDEKINEKTVDGVINSIGGGTDIEDDEVETKDDYYTPDPEDQPTDDIEKEPKSISNVKVNIKQMEYELASLYSDIKAMASRFKTQKPEKGTEDYTNYVKEYKALNSQIKKLESEIENELESGIEETKSLRESFQKRAGIIL